MGSSILPSFRTISGLLPTILIYFLIVASCASDPGSTGKGHDKALSQTEKFKFQPFGDVPAAQVKLVADALEAYFDCEVTIQPAIDLPQSAWYAPRKRYRADSLLRFLHRNLEPEYDRAFGLTAKDISTTKEPHEDWGIMGLGSSLGKVCVVSTFRVKKGVGKKQFETRLKRVALHEVGHTMGLPHCPNNTCLMRDANGKVSTVDEEGDELCNQCKVAIAAHLRKD